MGEKKSEYTTDIATHYKSFRPPLHEILLKRSLKNQRFESALDIGCGTGNSSIALTKYCASVTGYDPNKSMIQYGESHPKVFFTEKLEEINKKFSLIVFFGSLHYITTKSFNFYKEKLVRGGYLLCSDFEILYAPILSNLEITLSEIDYDHSKNLASYPTKTFALIRTEKFKAVFDCDLNELTHLILSETYLRPQLIEKYGSVSVVQSLLEDLKIYYPKNKIAIEANLFYTYYKNIED